MLKHLGLVAKSAQRDRRPTLEELDKLMEHYNSDREKRYLSLIPMRRLIAFAIFSTRLQEEILRITWVDYDEEHKRVLMDMKNPGEKIGNDVWWDLTPEAIRIIGSMPKAATEIFPCEAKSIRSSFTKACALLDIEDLHFLDFRHEGISRLFELGCEHPHFATVSGHRRGAR